MTENWQRAEQAALFPFGPLSHIQCALPLPGEHLRLLPLLCNRHTETKEVAQMKEQIKAPGKILRSDDEIASLSDAQFKTRVIRILTELVEYGSKLEEKMKAMLSEIKENV